MRKLAAGVVLFLLGVAVPATIPDTRGWIIVLWALIVATGLSFVVSSPLVLSRFAMALQPYLTPPQAIPMEAKDELSEGELSAARETLAAVRRAIVGANTMLSRVQRSGVNGAVEGEYASWLHETTRGCAERSELIVGLGSEKELYPRRQNELNHWEDTPADLIIVNRLTHDLRILRAAATELSEELRGHG
jgi:hypothetical protein